MNRFNALDLCFLSCVHLNACFIVCKYIPIELLKEKKSKCAEKYSLTEDSLFVALESHCFYWLHQTCDYTLAL